MPASGLKLRHRLASTDRQYRTHRTDKQQSDILQRFTAEDLQILFWAPHFQLALLAAGIAGPLRLAVAVASFSRHCSRRFEEKRRWPSIITKATCRFM